MKPGRCASRLAILIALASCRAPQTRSEPATITATDDLGRAVTLRGPARRIVSLVPATTELLYAIGAGDAVVGRTQWCDYPDSVLRVPSVGDGIGPNLELVIARRPDLVLLYAGANAAAVIEPLGRLRIPVMSLGTDRLSDVPRLARLLGHVTGHDRAADSVARTFERELADAEAPARNARSAFLLVWDQPPMTVGSGSFLTELMARAGLRNIFADVRASSAVISIEGVVARNPDIILTLGIASPRIAGRPEWAVVPAVREGRFVHAEGSEFSHPGPRSPQAVRELRQAVEAAVP
jgi:ABC-type Fe3+-hydroxamate transport system substrate-binding protein